MQIKKYIPVLALVLLFPFKAMTQYADYDFTTEIFEECGVTKIKFTFFNTPSAEPITIYSWDFGSGMTSYVRDPDTLYFTTPGSYAMDIILFFGPDSEPLKYLIMKDTTFTVYPVITADFSYSDTTEIGYYAISFKHQDQDYSYAGIYEWDFGDGTGSDQRYVVHTYAGPGVYNVKLKVSNVIGCADSTTQIVTLAAPPGMPDIIASDTFGCGEARVKYSLANVDTDTITTINWDFGNGSSSSLVDPDTVIYNNPGLFDISVVINGDIIHRVIEEDLIHVQLLPSSDFSYNDTVTFDTYVLLATGAADTAATYTYSWDIEGVGSYEGQRQLVKFPFSDTSYIVKLTVADNFGCVSSDSTIISVFEELQVQNVFTPNNDGINDIFEVSSNGSVPLSIKIFTRTGSLVYETEGYTITWDGRTAWGLELSQGVYFYVLDAINNDPNKRFRKTGFIYLYR
ncbi:MAG: gliding motility-associated C-terminal domain-containing protein [Bacteroidales bacterium]|nr:gliding motility-associated C-terminal domain-containing protein [Bacteroidales bacterium]